MKKLMLFVVLAALLAGFTSEIVAIRPVCNLQEDGLQRVTIASRVSGIVRMVEVTGDDSAPQKYYLRFTSDPDGNIPASLIVVKPAVYRVSLNWVYLGKVDLRGFCFWFPMEPTY